MPSESSCRGERTDSAYSPRVTSRASLSQTINQEARRLTTASTTASTVVLGVSGADRNNLVTEDNVIFIYTEDEPGRRLVSAAGTPKDRAAVFATEMQRLGFHKVAWLEGPFGLTQVFAVAVTAPDATQRQQMPAEVCGFKLREAGFDPGALPHPLVQATDHLDEP